jgi:hypothetical protein
MKESKPLPDAQRPSFSRRAERAIANFRGVPDKDPPGMRKRPARELASVVEDLRIRYGIGRSSIEDAIRERWPELVGPANAAYSHPLRMEPGRRLIVLASHSVVRNELFLHREAIVERIRQLPGCSELKELWIRAG